MKKTISVLFLVFSITVTMAQNFYIKRSTDNIEEHPFFIIQCSNSNSYLMTSYYKKTTSSIPIPTLYKLRNNAVVDSLQLLSERGYLYNVIEINDNLYSILGYVYNSTTNKYDLLFSQIDSSFNILLTRKYSTIYQKVPLLMKTIINHNNEYISSSWGEDFSSIYQAQYTRINNNGDLITMHYFDYPGDTSPHHSWDIIEYTNDRYIAPIGANYLVPLVGNGAGFIKMDTLFNVIGADSTRGQINLASNIKKIANNKLLYCGEMAISPKSKMRVLILDTVFNIQNTYTSTSQDTMLKSPAYQNVDFINKNNIYVAFTNSFQDLYPFGTDPSWIDVINFDSLLNVRWKKHIGGDMYYGVNSILATTDGGCMIIGTFYNNAIGIHQRDFFALKLDSLGNTVMSIPNNIGLNSGISVFPNPCSNMLTVTLNQQITKPVTIQIFNVLGKEIFQTLTTNTENTFNISDLSNGIYLVKIENESGVELQKVVKN